MFPIGVGIAGPYAPPPVDDRDEEIARLKTQVAQHKARAASLAKDVAVRDAKLDEAIRWIQGRTTKDYAERRALVGRLKP
jgi:hypothetical protein